MSESNSASPGPAEGPQDVDYACNNARAVRIEAIKRALGALPPRFLCWGTLDGRKVPKNLSGTTIDATKPANWSSLDDTLAWGPSPGGDRGPAVALGDLGDGRWLVGIDLDNCRAEDGTLHPDAARIVTKLASYTEVSPSGSGLRVFGLIRRLPEGDGVKFTAPWPKVREKGKATELCFHRTGRYYTLTGDHYGASPAELRDITDMFCGLVAAYSDAKRSGGKRATVPRGSAMGVAPPPALAMAVAPPPVVLPDVIPDIDVSKLRVGDELKAIIELGINANIPERWPSRNECVLWAMCEMVRAGHTNTEMASVLLSVGAFRNERQAPTIRDHVHDNGKGSGARRSYAERQIEQARKKVAEAAAQGQPEAGEKATGRYDMTDLGNSRRLLDAHGGDLRYCYQAKDIPNYS